MYKTSRIIPSRNLKVDSLESYLSTLQSVSFTDFQYIRPKLDGTIKVNMGQEYALWDSYVFDYLKVTNGNGEKTQYYFITKVEQRSEETLELTIHMDVINTFKDAYTISPNSVIRREFKDRFEKVTDYKTTYHAVPAASLTDSYFGTPLIEYSAGRVRCNIKDKFFTDYPDGVIYDCYIKKADGTYLSSTSCTMGTSTCTATFGDLLNVDISEVQWYFKYDFENAYYPIIDYLSEGIEPQLYKTFETAVPQFADQSWNLVYRGENAIEASAYNQVNPVNVYLVPDNGTPIKYNNLSANVKTATDFASAKYTFFRAGSYGTNLGIIIERTNGKTEYQNMVSEVYLPFTGHQYVDAYVYSDGSTLTIYRKQWSNGSYSSFGSYSNIAKITFLDGAPSLPIGVLSSLPDIRPDESALTSTLATGAYGTDTTLGVQDIGLTDARLMKVVKLPYAPASGAITTDGVEFDSWAYSPAERMYKGEVTGKAYLGEYDYTSKIASPLKDLSPQSIDPSQKKIAWTKARETKLLHSDFHQAKFVYDSFNFLFELEKVDGEEWRTLDDKEWLKFDFVVTSTVNSRFFFRFPDYVLDKSQSDYDNIMPVSRNNEVTIYSNQYVNYLRTGYNYDVKNKHRQQVMSAFGLEHQASRGVELYNNLRGHEFEHPLATGVSTGFSILGNIVSNIYNIKQAEESLERKKMNMLNQATAVSGSDDIDLLVAYGNNQAKMVYYNPSEMMTNALATLFHYCGYVSERRGVPTENTRYWFDYCQADIEFINDKHAPVWALDEIKYRYSLGLTILHCNSNEWDFDQNYENWEVAL